MSGLQLAGLAVSDSSGGSSGVGLVVLVVALTIGSAIVLSWLIGKLPEKRPGTPLFPRRSKKDPFSRPPDGPMDQPPRGPFDT